MSAASTSPPRVSVLSVTPVKGFALHHPPKIDLDASGAVGDRDFFLVDQHDKLVSITRTGAFAGWRAEVDPDTETLTFTAPSGEVLRGPVVDGDPVVANFFGERDVPGRVVDGPWTERFSELADRPLRLVRATRPGDGSDEFPVTLLADESVAAVGAFGSVDDLDRRRFRMLVGLTGVPAFGEEAWEGRRARLGTAVLRVRGPVPRCAGTTRNPDSGESDVKTLHLINGLRGRTANEFGDGLNLGVYGTVEEPGTVSVGDVLEVE